MLPQNILCHVLENCIAGFMPVLRGSGKTDSHITGNIALFGRLYDVAVTGSSRK